MSQKPIKKTKSNTSIPFEYFNMTPVPPSDTPPYTRDELITITLKILNDMNQETKIQMATFITDLMLKKAHLSQ